MHNTISNMIQGLFLIGIEVICCKIFFEIFSKKRSFSKKIYGYTLIIMLVSGLFFSSLLLSKYIFIKQIIVLILITIIMYNYFYTKIFKVIILTIIFQGMLLGIDYLTFIIFNYILINETEIFLTSIIGSTLITLISKTFLFAIILIARRKWNNNDSLNILSNNEWFRFLYFPTMTLIILISIFFSLSNPINNQLINTMLIIGFGLVFMNILLLYIIRDIIDKEKKIQESNILQERIKNQNNMYKISFENYDIQRNITHEYKNQIGCIEGLLQSGNIEKTLKYLSKITGKLKKEVDSIDTNNIIVNTILNMKYNEAIEKDIVFVLKVNDLSQMILSDEDIVIILSNLLNNAIEACERNKDNKIIKLKLIYEEELLTIAVKNTIEHEIIKKNEHYQTSKDNLIEHGIGISNITETVDKYEGQYIISHDESYFNFIIIIPHKKVVSI